MKFNNYETYLESLELLQEFPDQFATHSGIEKTFEGYSIDRQNAHLVPLTNLTMSMTSQFYNLDRPEVHFYVYVQGSAMLITGQQFVDAMLEISISETGDVVVEGQKVNAEVLRICLEHMDNSLLRAAELNTHIYNQMKQASELSPMDSLTLLQQRYQGDELVNKYLRGTLTSEDSLDILRRFTNKEDSENFAFPLESQAIQTDFDWVYYSDLLEASELRTTRGLAAKLRNLLKEKLETMLQLFVYDLQRIIGSAPRGTRMTVQRGVRVDNESLLKKTSQTIDFVSTSTDMEVAQRFAGLCCLLTQFISDKQPILHFNRAVTRILIQNVQKDLHRFRGSELMQLFEGLEEDEVVLMSNTPVEWIGLVAIVKEVPTSGATRNVPFLG